MTSYVRWLKYILKWLSSWVDVITEILQVIFTVTTVIKIEGKYDIAIRQEELQGGTLWYASDINWLILKKH